MWRKALLLVALVALSWFILKTQYFQSLAIDAQLRQFFENYGLWAWPLISISCIFFTAVGGSRQLVALICGALLGGWQGCLVSTGYTLLGALLTIGFSYYFAPVWLYRRYGAGLGKLQQSMQHRTWLWVCTLRLLPVGSNVLTNLACGLAKLPLSHVLAGSLIGYLPQMALFSYIGSGLVLTDTTQLIVGFALLLGSILLGTVLYRQQFRLNHGQGIKGRPNVR